MEEPNSKETQAIATTLSPSTSTQATVHDVAMEEAPVLNAAEKDSKVTADSSVNNQRIVEEFQYLLEKSQQLFAGLRDLPPTGGRQWQPYFQKTFEVYTKLWKFQQQNRFVLENKENYGLKRWEVGEIASKIGQLYYHYYLRTSETNYLHESYIFYEAIRERSYFKDVLDIKTPALMIKKLRYYARFIVVCLLLNRREIVQNLMEELSGFVDDYIRIFRPVDSIEWQSVLQEIGTFLEAEKKLVPVSPKGHYLPIARRLQIERSPRLEKDGSPKLKLQEAILVGNYQNQIKFSELTLDMYHILQSLEREPAPPKGAPKVAGVENSSTNERGKDDTSVEEQSSITPADKSASRRVNPHKYLLYKPSFSQLMVYIATAFKEINENSAMLLYISADGAKRSNNNDQNQFNGYGGGVATSSKKLADKSETSDNGGLANCLHPDDLVPFTRKSLCLIIDSNNSTAFANFPMVFNQPFLCLMSPTEYPASIPDTQIGSLFTLFLHAPLLGFAFISGIGQLNSDDWEKCVNLLSESEAIIVELFNSSNLERSVKRFLQDDFLRQFLVRFVLCSIFLKFHNSFQEEKNLPSSCPSLPSAIFDSPDLLAKLDQITKIVHVESNYSFPNSEIEEENESITQTEEVSSENKTSPKAETEE
ncbi:15258_t:CDS:10 [Acaulospora morrowiae]|uniref:15258_t:CDS:1 n=1 Tax=Acaulospora morrowiae TaxID=94023 RepID=A0A9N9D3J0_9GLOM|nr:15258_t:CDS:10 [Acaulospora morrowiae]